MTQITQIQKSWVYFSEARHAATWGGELARAKVEAALSRRAPD